VTSLVCLQGDITGVSARWHHWCVCKVTSLVCLH